MKTQSTRQFALLWLAIILLGIGVVYPALYTFVHDTLVLPSLLADMYVALATSFAIAAPQALLLARRHGKYLSGWLSSSITGAVLATLLVGVINTLVGAWSSYELTSVLGWGVVMLGMGFGQLRLLFHNNKPAQRDARLSLALLSLTFVTSGILPLLAGIFLALFGWQQSRLSQSLRVQPKPKRDHALLNAQRRLNDELQESMPTWTSASVAGVQLQKGGETQS